jgi:hypothetical protein
LLLGEKGNGSVCFLFLLILEFKLRALWACKGVIYHLNHTPSQDLFTKDLHERLSLGILYCWKFSTTLKGQPWGDTAVVEMGRQMRCSSAQECFAEVKG